MPTATSVEGIAELLRSASAAGDRLSVDDIDLSGLDRVLEHEAGDLTCTVEAGIRLSALQELLAAHGQRLSLDPPGDPTIGACIAADLRGPLSHRYGRMRDLLLGVTVVLGDGLVASSGGKVVKNVAGYDLGKLLCGSRGTLGVVVRASLRLHPVPEAAATLVASVASLDDGWTKSQTIRRSTLVPSALDITTERLAVMFEGSTRAVAAQLSAATALVGGERADNALWDEVRQRPQPEPDAPGGTAAEILARLRAELDPSGTLSSA